MYKCDLWMFPQVLKPSTRKKLKIEGEMYRKILMENFETLPSYLGGNCTCRRCSNLRICNLGLHQINETNKRQRKIDIISCEDIPSPHPSDPIDIHMTGYCDQALRAAVVGIIMLWVLIAFLAGLYDPESSPALPL